MPDEKRVQSDDTTVKWASDDLGARSVLVTFAPQAGYAGIGLRELADELPVPASRTGPEKYQMVRTVGRRRHGKGLRRPRP